MSTGVIRHAGVERYHKLNSIDTLERGAHIMSDDELFFQLSVYSDTNAPTPDDTQRRLLRDQHTFMCRTGFAAPDGWIAHPTQASGYVVGEAVRFGDTVLFSKLARGGCQETFSAKVLAILPKVDRGVFIVTATPPEVVEFCKQRTWLDMKDGEEQHIVPATAFQAHEQQIIAVKRGPMWNSPTRRPVSR